MSAPSIAHGHCLCGAVEFEIHGPLRPVIYCHCSMCRRSTGHFFAATACARDDLHLKSEQALRWYASSPTSRRGFCGQCGSQLFWDSKDASHVSVLAGSLNTPTGLTGQEHIFVADAGDYYTIDDGLPQKAAW